MYGYNVEYSGVGETDKIPNLGYCSQIATFNRLQDISYDPIKKEETYKFVIIFLIFLQWLWRDKKISSEIQLPWFKHNSFEL